MKKNLFLLLVLYHFTVSAQDDSVEIKFAPTLTEPGKPAGEKISQKIGKDGGKLISPDGRMELIIPQDAVSSKTNISIQPVVNTLSPGKGNAYQLEPSGITFQKPLQIIFHYTAKEAEGMMPEYKEIAWQDDKGQWYSLENQVVDTIARTVTGSITHFSTWVFFDAFILQPAKAKVRVNRQLDMFVVCTMPKPGTAGGMITDETIPKQIRFSTYANGIKGGNAVAGTVSSVYGQAIRNVRYTAPANIPDQNPVAVSVETSNVKWNGRSHPRLKLVSNITIIDKSFEITVTGYNKQHVLQCTISSFDTSTCILQLAGKNTKLVDIQNTPIKVIVSSCPCDIKEINPGNNIGPINIVGAYKLDVKPADPPQHPYPFITVYFIRNMGSVPGMSVGPCVHQPPYSWPSIALPAVPMVLAFEAKDEEYTVVKEGTDNGFEIKVKPAKEDY